MRIKQIACTLTFLLALTACNSNDKPYGSTKDKYQNAPEAAEMANTEVKITEVIQGNSYTYLNVNDGSRDYWIATSKIEAKEGDSFSYTNALEMKNFESKELNRVFESIYLVQEMSNQAASSGAAYSNGTPDRSNTAAAGTEDIKVEPAKDGITLAELFANRSSYGGKSVTIRGQVTKFNPQIMGKNWLHIQDGTKADGKGNFDLTVTTGDMAKVGDTASFTGKITLNKDLGSGYSFEVIMEDATISQK